MATLILYLVFFALCAQPFCGDGSEGWCTGGSINGKSCVWNPETGQCENGTCGDVEHNTQPTCSDATVNDFRCVWKADRCENASCGDLYSTQPDCSGASVNGFSCVWNPGTAQCESVSCGDFQHSTQPTCSGAAVNGLRCVWDAASSLCITRTPGSGCEDSTHQTEVACTFDGYGNPCAWDTTNLICINPKCGDLQHNTAGTCTGSSVNGQICLWNPNGAGLCVEAGCGDFQHNTAGTCTGSSVNSQICVWNPDGPDLCVEAGCGDFGHSTTATCLGSSVNGRRCVWDATASNCNTFYTGSGCEDDNHQAVGSCTSDDNGNPCTWDTSNLICINPKCGDFKHNTMESCTSVNGQDCLWDPSANRCVQPSCYDFQHATEYGCNYYGRISCSWDPDGAGRCVETKCGDFEHNNQLTCTGVVNGYGCIWNGSHCEGKKCSDINDKNICDIDYLSCSWHEMQNEEGETCTYCWEDQGQAECWSFDEKNCKIDTCCVWADGRCIFFNSAHNMMVPALLVAVMLAFMLF